MTSKMKPNTRAAKTKETSGAHSARFRLKGSDWLVLPLGMLALVCAYAFTFTLPNHSYFTFSNPTIISLLVGVFSVTFVYKVLRGVPRHPVANVIAYIFSATLIILAGVLIATSGNECGGDCNASSSLVTWLVVFNPLIAMLWSPLAIVGIVFLVMKRRQ